MEEEEADRRSCVGSEENSSNCGALVFCCCSQLGMFSAAAAARIGLENFAKFGVILALRVSWRLEQSDLFLQQMLKKLQVKEISPINKVKFRHVSFC